MPEFIMHQLPPNQAVVPQEPKAPKKRPDAFERDVQGGWAIAGCVYALLLAINWMLNMNAPQGVESPLSFLADGIGFMVLLYVATLCFLGARRWWQARD
jgi:hypothetical protein